MGFSHREIHICTIGHRILPKSEKLKSDNVFKTPYNSWVVLGGSTVVGHGPSYLVVGRSPVLRPGVQFVIIDAGRQHQ